METLNHEEKKRITIFRAVGIAWIPWIGFLASTPLASAHEKPADESGVVALDVYAQNDRIELLVATKEGTTYRLEHRRSIDGGANFSSPIEIRPPGGGKIHAPRRGNDPQIAANHDDVVVFWTAAGATAWGNGPLWSSRSRDGGKTWDTAREISNRKPIVGQSYVDAVADETGGIHAVWLDSRDGSQGLRYAKSVDGGTTWAKTTTLRSKTCECCWNRIYAPRPNTLQVIFRDRNPRDMAIIASADQGSQWKKSVSLGAYDWRFKGCPHQGGALAYLPKESTGANDLFHALVWTGHEKLLGIHYLRSEDSGATWKETRPFTDPAAGHVDLAANGEKLLAVWDSTENGKRIVWAALSSDQGKTWAAPSALSPGNVRASYPRVVATGKHGFFIVWTEAAHGKPAVWSSKRIP